VKYRRGSSQANSGERTIRGLRAQDRKRVQARRVEKDQKKAPGETSWKLGRGNFTMEWERLGREVTNEAHQKIL